MTIMCMRYTQEHASRDMLGMGHHSLYMIWCHFSITGRGAVVIMAISSPAYVQYLTPDQS